MSLRAALARAMEQHQGGRLADAIEAYRACLRREPRQFDGLRLLGAALHDSGRYRDAIEILGQAIAVKPEYPECWRHIASCFFHLSRFEESAGAYGRALELGGDSFGGAHYWRAVSLREIGREREALEGFESALRAARAWADRVAGDRHAAMCFAGLASLGLGRGEEALAALDEAVALAPGWVQAWVNRGTVLTEGLRRHAEAAESFDRALALRPDDPDAWYNKGVALARLYRAGEALECFDRALSLRDDPEAEVHRLGCLMELDRCEEALAEADELLARPGALGKLWIQRGWALLHLRRGAEAIASMERALSSSGGDYKRPMNVALACLQLGDYERGWRLYESRLGNPDLAPRAPSDGVRWHAPGPIEGRRLLVHNEQGIGDMIQFVRFVPALLEAGARVTLEAPQPLHALLRSIGPAVELVEGRREEDAFDLHVPVMSLPFEFSTRLESIPARLPYLRAPVDALERWQARLGPAPDRLRIGIACSGNAKYIDDLRRSASLSRFACLADADAGGRRIELHLLQKDLRAADEEFLKADGRIADHRDELTDFGETAALALQMDLVISVDTSIAHLAGALGRPLWLLLPRLAEWRWMLDREDSPWYPGARLFRQSREGDWDELLDRLRAALPTLRTR